MGDAWDDIVAKSGLAPAKPVYGSTNGKAKPINGFTANLSNPRVAGALREALESAKTNIVTGQVTGLGRNNQLNIEAANLHSFAVGNNLMSETDLRDWLYDVAREAGLEHDENCGPKQIEDTIASGFKAGKHKYGPRDLSHLKDTVDVEFVEDLPGHPAGATDWKPVIVKTNDDRYEAIFDGDDEFWGARESLQHIYTAALSRMAPPWGTLANVTARVLATVRPNTVLPEIVGGPGSLNWFAAVAAESGGGKGASSACAASLIKANVDIRNLGSGEGICQQFYKPGPKGQPPVEHESIMFEATEIDAMTSLRERSGQTTMSVLRAGFSGETLGFSYRNNDHHVVAQQYRMTLVLSLQPKRARPLLDDADGGTPQRFQWFPATDRRVKRATRPNWPGELSVPGWKQWQYPRTLFVPQQAIQMIEQAAEDRNAGIVSALDGHALFVREKFAFALALLDGRTEMNDEDWELSGIAAEISSRTREWVIERLEVSEIEANERTGRTYGQRSAAAKAAEAAMTSARLDTMKSWLRNQLADGPKTNRQLKNAIDSSRRHWLPRAASELTEAGLIGKATDGRWRLL